MSVSRDMLRRQAKKLYKEQIKSVPKAQRVPFAKFFEHFKKKGNLPDTINPEVETEDFNFEDMVNVNEINDGDVIEVEEE